MHTQTNQEKTQIRKLQTEEDLFNRRLRNPIGAACMGLLNIFGELADLAGLGPKSRAARVERKAKENFQRGILIHY